MTVTLQAQPREAATKKDATGMVAGVVYGPKQPATSLSVERSTFEKLYKEAGESTVITLEGLGEAMEVLIHVIRHVDFDAIEKGKEITVDVPIEYVGKAPAEEKDGVLTKVLHEIEVTCAPAKLPQHIEVDVSVMTELDAPIRIKDLVVPAGVTIENDAEDVVAVVVAVEEESDETVSEVDMAAIEVEKKGKGEETEEEAK